MPHSECFIDGVWLPSVTTIMGAEPKPWIDKWRDKWGTLAERKMDLANAIGTAFHDCVECWLDNKVPDHSVLKYPSCLPRINGMVQSWVAWAQGIDGTIDHTELRVISKLHKYSGTLDAVGKIGKTKMVIDWKTSSRIYDSMQIQLAAYAHAYNEQTGSNIKDGLIVHVAKDKPYKVTTKAFKLGKRPFNEFLKLRAMFDEMKVQGDANEKISIE